MQKSSKIYLLAAAQAVTPMRSLEDFVCGKRILLGSDLHPQLVRSR